MPEHYYGKTYGGNATENYERYFAPAIGSPLAHDLVDKAGLRPGESVLDVACGTGLISRLASQKVGTTGSVTGLDINAGMLAVARSVTPQDTRIEWHEGSAEAMSLPDGSFDVVLCQMGLQFMENKPAALREMYRVLKPCGRLVLNLPGPTPKAMAVIKEALARHIGAEAAGFLGLVFSLHETRQIEDLIKGAGFSDVSVQADTKALRVPTAGQFLWEYVHSTPLSGAVAQVDEGRRAALEREVVEKCREFEDNGALVLQVRMVTASGRK